MTKYVKFNGQTHAFPDEASESDIMNALSSIGSPKAVNSTQKAAQGPKINPSQLPGSSISNFLMGTLQNSGSPKDILMSRLLAAKRGALDLGQGAKQLGLSALERMGSVPQGTTQNYTGNTDLQRLQYEQSPGSQDMMSKIIRSGISNSPYLSLGPGGEAGLIAKLVRGAAGGAGIGAASYAGQDQSRLANTLGGAATGAAVPALGSLGSKLKDVLSDIPGSIDSLKKLNPLSLTAKNIAKDIIDTRSQNKSKYNELYNDIFSDASKADLSKSYFLNKVRNEINYPVIKKNSTESQMVRIQNFIDDPTLENAHWALSDLKKMKLSKSDRKKLVGGKILQQNAIDKAIPKIEESMFKNDFGDVNDSLKNRYSTVSKGYSDEVIPYDQKIIDKFKGNKANADQLVKSLTNTGSFMAERGEYHPQLALRKSLAPYVKGAVAGTIATGLGADILSHLYNKSS